MNSMPLQPLKINALTTLFPGIHTDGPSALLDTPTRLLLVSRNAGRPSPRTGWVQSLLRAAEQALAAGETLVTGAGRIAYELPLLQCARLNRPLIFVARANETPCLTLPSGSIRLCLPATINDLERDTILGTLAKSATQVAVRNGGSMAALATAIAQRGGTVTTLEEVPPSPTPQRWPRKEIPVLQAFENWSFLTHFTREADGAWPGESHAAYLDWLCSGRNESRSGFETLCHILEERLLRGSGRFISGGAPMVCATELPPHAVATLRGWRRGLRRWNFTPYAIALPAASARDLGFRTVRYAPAGSSTNDPYFQAAQSGAYDWTREREWRAAGNVILKPEILKDALILTATESEAERVESQFGLRARATG